MFWTLLEEHSIRHRPIIDTGAGGRYGGIDLAIRPRAGSSAVEVDSTGVDEAGARWLAPLLAGFADYQQRRAAEGRPIGGVVLAIVRVHHHPIDTDARLMRRAAAEALQRVFEAHERVAEG